MVPGFWHEFASGVVYSLSPSTGSESAEFRGTCAMIYNTDTFVTAAHCVPEDFEPYVVVATTNPNIRRVVAAERDSRTDVAVIRTEPGNPETVMPDQWFQPTSGGLMVASDFMCFGFPAEGSPDNTPTGRIMKGHVQRYFGYGNDRPQGGFLAAEMSIPAPKGMSGSVLTYPHSPREMFAVVTTNLDSHYTVSDFSEVKKDGSTYQERVQRIVSYGIACYIDDPTLRGMLSKLD